MTTQDEMDYRAKLRTKSIQRRALDLELAAVLSRLRPKERASVAAVDAAILKRLGAELQRLAIAQCNRPWTDGDQRRRDKLKGQVKTIAGWYGLKAECGADPRGGSALRLYGRGVPDNCMGGGMAV